MYDTTTIRVSMFFGVNRAIPRYLYAPNFTSVPGQLMVAFSWVDGSQRYA